MPVLKGVLRRPQIEAPLGPRSAPTIIPEAGQELGAVLDPAPGLAPMGTDPMGPPFNRGGYPCPGCNGKHKAEVNAVIPMVVKGGHLIHAHQYAICKPCHKRQQRTLHGYTLNPDGSHAK